MRAMSFARWEKLIKATHRSIRRVEYCGSKYFPDESRWEHHAWVLNVGRARIAQIVFQSGREQFNLTGDRLKLI